MAILLDFAAARRERAIQRTSVSEPMKGIDPWSNLSAWMTGSTVGLTSAMAMATAFWLMPMSRAMAIGVAATQAMQALTDVGVKATEATQANARAMETGIRATEAVGQVARAMGFATPQEAIRDSRPSRVGKRRRRA